MKSPQTLGIVISVIASASLAIATLSSAQEQRPASSARGDSPPATSPARPGIGRGQRGPSIVSPEVGSDRRVSFRIFAPQAKEVTLSAGDIPGGGRRPLTKSESGVWEITLGPIDPGAYRYTFNVDGVPVVDPRSPAISESNANVWSVVYVPGSDFMDATDVPHGSVAAVYYPSTTLGRMRRAHVYTPPGYESNSEKYPVFYLLHGAGDSDDSWTSVGRANFILDNLIATGKAKPMIVVMPAGHTSRFSFMPPPTTRPGATGNEFDNDFVNDLMPYVEHHYRVIADESHRAIAGLSMGGAQTLSVALFHPGQFAYVGVFSSGLFTRNAGDWEKEHETQLDDAGAKNGLKLFWFKTGSQDFLLPNTKRTVELLQKHGFQITSGESTGGHTWINWRNYLNEFAPQLFR